MDSSRCGGTGSFFLSDVRFEKLPRSDRAKIWLRVELHHLIVMIASLMAAIAMRRVNTLWRLLQTRARSGVVFLKNVGKFKQKQTLGQKCSMSVKLTLSHTHKSMPAQSVLI